MRNLQHHFQLIRSKEQVRYRVRAVVIGDDRTGETGLRLRDGDSDPGQHGAALVGDTSIQRGGRLRPNGAAGEHKNQCACRDMPQECMKSSLAFGMTGHGLKSRTHI